MSSSTKTSETLLVDAIFSGDVKNVEFALSTKPNLAQAPASHDNWISLLIHDTTSSADAKVAIMRALLQAGMPVDATDGYGRTGLSWAAARDDAGTCRLLLEFKANVNAPGDPMPPLLHAVSGDGKNAFQAAGVLLAAGADASFCDGEGRNALHLLRSKINQNMEPALQALTRNLVAQGCELEHRSKSGDTPLTLACGWPSAMMVRVLLALGADINTPMAHGLTPVTYAMRHRYMEVVKTLLRNDPAPALDVVDSAGRTFMHHLMLHLRQQPSAQDLEVLSLALELGADVDNPREFGSARHTPMEIAQSQPVHHESVMAMLRAHQARRRLDANLAPPTALRT